MLRITRWFILLLACSVSCQPGSRDSSPIDTWGSLPIVRAPRRKAADKLSPHLRRLVDGHATGRVRVLVDLSVQLDLVTFGETLAREEAGKEERRRRVVTALQQIAENGQSQLQTLLDDLQERGSINSYEGLSIVNRLIVSGEPSAILALAQRDEVAEVVEETTRDALVLTEVNLTAAHLPLDRSWALDAIGVDSLWTKGMTGKGVVVGIIDTGASAAHEQLRGNFRGGAGSWYDASAKSTAPQDTRTGHGTTMLSVAVGQNLDGKILGVAPEAEWIACAGIPEGRYNNIALSKCADWMLNTGQPDVLINAWLLPGQGCDRSLERIVDAWRAAEILPVFSAGNDGPSLQSDRSPANYGGLYPGDGVALSVGAATKSGEALATSSRGPGSCDGSIYPALVAPAEDVMAAFPLTPSMYTWAEGTSVATGLVAGAVALLLQRYPQASATDLETALRSSALDLGPTGPDNTFGHGQVYLPAALDSLHRLLSGSLPQDVSDDTLETRQTLRRAR